MADPSFTVNEHIAGDGYCWRYREYVPVTAPKAHVVFLHGIQSHGGWYEYSCNKLREAGYRVSFLDRRGSGLNDKDRGDAPSFRRLLDDLAEFLLAQGQAGNAQTKLRVFLAAVSWGGKLAVALQRRCPGLANGLILMCPGLFPKVRPSFPQRLGIVLSRLVRPRKLFPIPLSDPELFTASPRWQQFIRDDRLALHQATARLLVESARLDGYLRFVPFYVRVPVLLMLAEHDRVIHNGRTRAYVERFISPDKTTIEYPGAHHTLEFEPEPDRFINDWIGWMEKRLEG